MDLSSIYVCLDTRECSSTVDLWHQQSRLKPDLVVILILIYTSRQYVSMILYQVSDEYLFPIRYIAFLAGVGLHAAISLLNYMNIRIFIFVLILIIRHMSVMK